MALSYLFERAPWLEVLAKNLHGRAPWLARWAGAVAKRRHKATPAAPASAAVVPFEVLTNACARWGIGEGDILVVHSSADLPKTLGMSPREVIAGLKAIVGESGTLAMPAIPLLKGEPAGAQRLKDESYETVLTYDVRRSPPWTGTLPRQLMQTAGSMRSHHPLNTMVALGPHAAAMMGHNLSEPEPMPCGPGSSWAYCHQHGAKILAINCDLAHSLTMIHVVEDMHDGGWPIRHWYRQRRFKVVADGAERMLTVRERRAHWSMFFAERSLSRQLAVQGISRTHQSPGLALTFCDSRELIAFARQHPDPVFPYWIPFHRLFSLAQPSSPSR